MLIRIPLIAVLLLNILFVNSVSELTIWDMMIVIIIASTYALILYDFCLKLTKQNKTNR